MTKVTFYQNSEQQCVGFDVNSHAGYAEEGEDIVCAAISALVINTVNSIETFTDDVFQLDVDEESADICLKVELLVLSVLLQHKDSCCNLLVQDTACEQHSKHLPS